MGINPVAEVNRAPRRILSSLAGVAVALTMVRHSAARFHAAKAEARDSA
jgi:hypothetical protein